ncbi:hypothetical protein COU78_02530 [Candidatus Peregrinibacteria bacterium CG10_big_fil_rev_8_21_14_0_10_49_24]|nr:MAG: hypothetical protein COV83_02510 [Candidatus Peregrinibacteria bacterium CG11_big_fil_rev_8_21_14_0_20_49_14]PIR51013.1 MAG: hypothetical protein COU78_02530 [Candidatus Peregrinibacteria bacterium CG10_big_fil_rev_8_21_14_0_10_49_24]PJA67566.1 MAG: hypothetical protein CO157_04010 [Candidatus Peregrinibacteria bacterium CG_4_9_14_3_um_filter_49_12]
MTSASRTHITVLFPEEGESWAAFSKRITAQEGSMVIVLTGPDAVLATSEKDRKIFLQAMAAISGRVQIASRQRVVIAAARSKGIRVIDTVADLKHVLDKHPSADEAIRVFSPRVWQQKIRSNLQAMGLLSLPKLRVITLIVVSATVFFFVLFRLLPSAVVRVWPREDTISQTVNIFLVLSGSTVSDIPSRVRTLELIPIEVNTDQLLTFDQISKQFMGTSAKVAMSVLNESSEKYDLRTGTRVMNQAGMIFRLQEPAVMEPGEEVTVRAEADDLDLYGEIIGERGNVPADLRWDIPGLAKEEQQLVYAINRAPAFGGDTAYRTVLHEEDIEIAKKRLEQELLATAKQLVEEQRELYNSEHPDRNLEILYYDELTKSQFHDFALPEVFLGKSVKSVPIEGQLTYIAYAYNSAEVLEMLRQELAIHVEDDKRLLNDTLTLDRLVAHVIDYNDELSWIKLTVDLSGTVQYVLDPLSPTGAKFAKKIREMITGKDSVTAARIVQNLPEVKDADINIWPPWNRALPHIPSHISIEVLTK